MPFVVTANCIVCKDLEVSDGTSAEAQATPASKRADITEPRLPEHFQQPAPDLIQPTEKPDADDAASG